MTELGRIPVDWNVERLAKLVKRRNGAIKIGPFGSQLKKNELSPIGIKVYGQENVINHDFETGNRFVSTSKYRALKSFEIYPNDVLISMMGTVGYAAIFPPEAKKGIMDSHLLRIQPDPRFLEPRFLSILLSESWLVEEQINKLSQGSIMGGLNSKIVRSLVIPVPSLIEQQKIAKVLSDTDALIESFPAMTS